MKRLITPIDYDFYKTVYRGSSSATDFYSKLAMAIAYVDTLIYPNTVEADNQDAYKRAICAVVDYHLLPDEQKVTSYRVGQVSVTRSASEQIKPAELARMHLTGSGLLCKAL